MHIFISLINVYKISSKLGTTGIHKSKLMPFICVGKYLGHAAVSDLKSKNENYSYIYSKYSSGQNFSITGQSFVQCIQNFKKY